MINLDDALALIEKHTIPLGHQSVPIASAHDRVLAEPLFAPLDAPMRDVSAMDGYAVRRSELANAPVTLPVADRIFAGDASAGTLPPQSCIRVFTGSPIPDGADTVVIQENVEETDSGALFGAAPGDHSHIRKRGHDFARGDRLLDAGTRLDYRKIVLAAGADCEDVTCFARPKVQILATGSELVPPGQARTKAGAIAESVSFGVAGLVSAHGGVCTGSTHVADDLESTVQAASLAVSEADCLVLTGGASVGERDFARAALEELGMTEFFTKVAIKPGKPVWFGRVNDCMILGLPGNPTSALVTARLMLVPLLKLMGGERGVHPLEWAGQILAGTLPETGERDTLYRGVSEADGRIRILSNQDSSAQQALAQAQFLVRRRANSPALVAGDAIDTLAF